MTSTFGMRSARRELLAFALLHGAMQLFDARFEAGAPRGQADAEGALDLGAIEARIGRPLRRPRPVGNRDRLDPRDSMAEAGPAFEDRLGKAEPRGLARAGHVIDPGLRPLAAQQLRRHLEHGA